MTDDVTPERCDLSVVSGHVTTLSGPKIDVVVRGEAMAEEECAASQRLGSTCYRYQGTPSSTCRACVGAHLQRFC